MKPIIRVENLSKQYRIGAKNASYGTLREKLVEVARSPLKRFQKNGNRDDPTIWALRDVSFEVQQGEVLGIVGRNGAGKSTLLKILARITEPTSGQANLDGRIASLLEVGTGFHPELSGRQNVFLNGAILGMRRAEIVRRFDEIVAFSGVDKFLDTPVKHYSSGMYMRLAFSVAMHLEPEILIVDEVLAVGDAQFQRKCLDKIQEVGRAGRTILFVSHNMAAVRGICKRGIELREGRIVSAGQIDEVVDSYLSEAEQWDHPTETETESFTIKRVKVESGKGSVIKTFDPVTIKVQITPKRHIVDPGLYVGVLTLDGQRLLGLDIKDFVTVSPLQCDQTVELGFQISELPILAGSYRLEVHLKDMATHLVEVVAQTYPFEIVESPVYGGRKLDGWFGHVGLRANPIVER